MANQIETNLFEEELTDADLMAVVGGNVSSTLEGVTAGAGQTVGIALNYTLTGATAFNNAENGFLGNATAPVLNQVPV